MFWPIVSMSRIAYNVIQVEPFLYGLCAIFIFFIK